MDLQTGKELILNQSKAFRDNYFKAYGQIALRLDCKTYLMTNENTVLSDIKADDINQYRIGKGTLSIILKSRHDINAIAFVCTNATVEYSKTAVKMIPSLDDVAQIIGVDVKICDKMSGRAVLRALKNRNGCFIRGKGMLTTGANLNEVIAAARILEKGSEVELLASKIGGPVYLNKTDLKVLNKFYKNSYSKVNKTGQIDFVNIDDEEFRMRNEIIDIGKQLVRDGLVQGTWGNISLRLNEKEMLVTPSGMDYFSIKTEDIVKMDIDTLEYGNQRKPTSESKLHAAIYKAKPACKAIIHTHSNCCSVFAAARKGFQIENEQIHELIGNVTISAYASPGTDALAESVIEALKNSRACIISNHGAVFCGDSLPNVLAISNGVEKKACAILGGGFRS